MKTILGTSLKGTIDLKNSDGWQHTLSVENGELIEITIKSNGKDITAQVISGKIHSIKKLKKRFFSFVGTNHGKYLHTVGVLELDSQDGFHVKKEICICGINNGIWFSDKEKAVKLYKRLNIPFLV